VAISLPRLQEVTRHGSRPASALGVMALAPMSRAAFSLDAGAPFDSLI